MDGWILPREVQIGGKVYHIHSDYRDILEVIRRLADPDTPAFVRWIVALALFYEEKVPPQDREEAIQQLNRFICCGQPEPTGRPPARLLDWEQDAMIIVADVNRVAGCEVRSLPYLHWWTFMAYFNAIGEGQLSTVVSIRSKLHRGEKLQDWEKTFYRDNKERIDLKRRYSPEELQERQRIKTLLGE